jgi:hypothetical protein
MSSAEEDRQALEGPRSKTLEDTSETVKEFFSRRHQMRTPSTTTGDVPVGVWSPPED